MPFKVIRLHLIECFFRLHTANTFLKQLQQLSFQSAMSLGVFCALYSKASLLFTMCGRNLENRLGRGGVAKVCVFVCVQGTSVCVGGLRRMT